MRTKTTNYIIFECLSRSANEAFARGAVACFAAQLDPTLEELGDIKTAVSEAVTNAIVHAYPDTLGRVVVKAKILEDNVLEVTVRDWGRGIEDVERARQCFRRYGLCRAALCRRLREGKALAQVFRVA